MTSLIDTSDRAAVLAVVVPMLEARFPKLHVYEATPTPFTVPPDAMVLAYDMTATGPVLSIFTPAQHQPQRYKALQLPSVIHPEDLRSMVGRIVDFIAPDEQVGL